MLTVRVPLKQDKFFENEFKKYLLSKINSLYLEYREIPDEVVFRGHLGSHLFNLVKSNNWNFGKTKTVNEKGPNQLEIRFTRNITIKKNTNLASSISNSLDGKVVEGILDDKSRKSIINSSIDTNFSVEKTVTPNLLIKLEELI